MDGRCKTCKWWYRLLDSESTGTCELAGWVSGYPDGHKDHPESKAWAAGESYEEIEAWLVTAPDFGCVQWEAKGDD